MQRIYADGKIDLPGGLPANWRRPAKIMNHRCPTRVIQLINKIRSAVDGHEQKGRTDKETGSIRLFIVPANTADKAKAEAAAAQRMAEITGDDCWGAAGPDFKTLTLEHLMAARRMGFVEFFEPLYSVDRLRTGLLDGSLPGLPFFTHDVMPLVEAKLRGDEYAVAAIVRQRSPLLEKEFLKLSGSDQPKLLKAAREAVNELIALWKGGASPSLMDVLRCVQASGLFRIPESLRLVVSSRDATDEGMDKSNSSALSDEKRDEAIEAWEQSLSAPFQQVVSYARYISGEAPFDTHQGVKGLEFPRVMVIIDDDESRGFLFSYDKLLGAKAKSDTDISNERAGKETTIDRTRRLFYVTCSRAESSLAIVHYSSDPVKVKDHAVAEGWFEAGEIEIIE